MSIRRFRRVFGGVFRRDNAPLPRPSPPSLSPNIDAMKHKFLLLGATSAIAHATARLWVQRGAALVLVGRDAVKLQQTLQDLQVRAGPQAHLLHAIQADLEDVSRHAALIDEAWQRLGGLDGVLIAHGTLPDQTACDADVSLALAHLHTNGVSVVSLCAHIAQRMKTAQSGTLAVISSVAGDRGRQSNYLYGAAKGLVSLYLQGLRNRLYPHGVHVLTIKPGFVDTPMTAGIGPKGALWATPERVAADIVRAMDRNTDVLYTPGFWRFIMMVVRHIPERVFKRLRL